MILQSPNIFNARRSTGMYDRPRPRGRRGPSPRADPCQRPLRNPPTRLASDLACCLAASPSDFAADIAALPAGFAEFLASVALFSAALRCLVAAPFLAAACRSAFVRCAMVCLLPRRRYHEYLPTPTRAGDLTSHQMFVVSG